MSAFRANSLRLLTIPTSLVTNLVVGLPPKGRNSSSAFLDLLLFEFKCMFSF